MNTITKATFNELVIRHNGEYCRLLWERLPDSGTYSGARWNTVFLTSYGTWSSHVWYIGSDDLLSFLSSLESEYLARNLIGEYQQFSPDKTVESVHRYIIERRRSDSMQKHDARTLWNSIESLADEGDLNKYTFHSDIDWEGIDDWWELAASEVVPHWQGFWENLWLPAVVPALREASDKNIAMEQQQ